jgi:hypothetical protein
MLLLGRFWGLKHMLSHWAISPVPPGKIFKWYRVSSVNKWPIPYPPHKIFSLFYKYITFNRILYGKNWSQRHPTFPHTHHHWDARSCHTVLASLQITLYPGTLHWPPGTDYPSSLYCMSYISLPKHSIMVAKYKLCSTCKQLEDRVNPDLLLIIGALVPANHRDNNL